MSSRQRWRRWTRWPSLALTLALATLWVATETRFFYYSNGRGTNALAVTGTLGFWKTIPGAATDASGFRVWQFGAGTGFEPGSSFRRLFPRYEVPPVGPEAWRVLVPIWPLLAISLIAGAWSWWPQARAPGSCHRCGYARSGLAPDAACPECGSVARSVN